LTDAIADLDHDDEEKVMSTSLVVYHQETNQLFFHL
jgi:ABC-type oligopeptide transport system ATPase subunit